jgi:nitrogen-specific signal transduction histidine kinase
MCAIIRDVTVERETQKRFFMQERLAMVGSLAAGIVHDFNNSLLPITLYSEILLDEKSDDPSAVELLEVVLQQAQHAAGLTKQILDFSRQSEASMLPLDLTVCVRELLKLLERTFPENIHMIQDSGPGYFVVNGDSNRLQQALLNLALNARDAMSGGGELRFRLSRLRLDPGDQPPFLGLSTGDWVRLDITDTGEGILAEHAQHIFEPFFTTKKNGGGHGLGLAQVYGIVKQHQGYIDVVSRYRKGTTFTIFLPAISENEEMVMEIDMDTAIVGNQETILLVEDDEITRQAICETLEYMNYRVLVASSGKKALEIYNEETVHLVLCDLVMPEMSGAELTDALMERDPDAKIVIITGYPQENLGSSLIEQGVTEVIQKPADMKSITKTVRRALRS